jgi:hypothetical protein
VDDREILVSFSHADGTASVFHDQDGAWLAGVAEGGSRLEGYRPAVEGLARDRTVQGGLLPPGAVAAEVIDETGARHRAAAENGAWVIVLDQAMMMDPSPVHYIDARGETVAPPLPAEWPRTPVPDAEEPCPVCGAVAWDQVRALDESRGMQTRDAVMIEPPRSAIGTAPPVEPEPEAWEPTPFLVCRVCGHEESGDVWYGPRVEAEEKADPEELARSTREARAELRRGQREALERVEFPIYAIEGWPTRLLGWGGNPRLTVQSVVVDQGTPYGQPGPRLWVRTEAKDEDWRARSDRELLYEALEELLGAEDGAWPQRSDAAMTLWSRGRERERRQRVARADIVPRHLSIDDKPEKVLVAETQGKWAAIWRGAGLLVVVAADGVGLEAVALKALSDPYESLVDPAD